MIPLSSVIGAIIAAFIASTSLIFLRSGRFRNHFKKPAMLPHPLWHRGGVVGGVYDDDEDADTAWGRALEISAPKTQLVAPKIDPSEVPSEEIDIAIVGGGIAGLAAAIGLSRSLPSKFKVRVFERASKLRTDSQGMLSLWPNGLNALERVHPDLPSLVRDAGTDFRTAVGLVIASNGTVKESYEMPAPTGLPSGSGAGTAGQKEGESAAPSAAVLIRWHSLQVVLASLLPSGTVLTGKSLSSYIELPPSFFSSDNERGRNSGVGGVLLRFDDGTTVKCRAALAADGVFSVARRQMAQEEMAMSKDDSDSDSDNEKMEPDDKPIFFGQMNWNAIVPTSSLPPNVHPPNAVTSVRYEGNSARDKPKWSMYLNDCGSNHTFWQLRVADEHKARSLSGSSGRGGLGLPGVKGTLLPIVEDSALATTVLKSIPEERIFERCIVARLPVMSNDGKQRRSWISQNGKGHLALVGDAAHGMHPGPGQGANNALESAATVVEAIAEAFHQQAKESGRKEQDWAAAGLREYELRRRPRAELVQRFANLLGCGQSTGEYALTEESRRLWWDWTKSLSSNESPPEEGEDLVRTFDPRLIPEVSML